MQVRGQFDNRYVECVRRFPRPFLAHSHGGYGPAGRPAGPGTLGPRRGYGGTPGSDHAFARQRPPGDLAPGRRAATAGQFAGTHQGFTAPEFAQVLREFPALPIIVEHLGGIGPTDAPPYPKFRQLLALAQYSNVYMKIHGLGEICPRPMPFPEPMRFPNVPPFMRMAYDAFGPSRLMWGSDFPPVANREGYRNALRWTMEHVAFCQ